MKAIKNIIVLALATVAILPCLLIFAEEVTAMLLGLAYLVVLNLLCKKTDIGRKAWCRFDRALTELNM